ncbi:MAG: hypothetical protein AMS27_01750 [Bacteroides sp. SM23_62_1]|nr:MAG: hypothetical protein AMS27_01750 [Bacteroides sp. SM23_62_1]
MSKLRDKLQQRTLLINGIAFLVLGIICATEKNYLLSGILIFTSAFNIIGFRIWKERKLLANAAVNLFNAIVSFTAAYDFYMKESRHIWKIYLLVALAYFVIAIVIYIKYSRERKIYHEKQNPPKDHI